jgi:hypothetical protein
MCFIFHGALHCCNLIVSTSTDLKYPIRTSYILGLRYHVKTLVSSYNCSQGKLKTKFFNYKYSYSQFFSLTFDTTLNLF